MQAMVAYEQAIEIARHLNDRWQEGRLIGNLGNVYLAAGQVATSSRSLLTSTPMNISCPVVRFPIMNLPVQSVRGRRTLSGPSPPCGIRGLILGQLFGLQPERNPTTTHAT